MVVYALATRRHAQQQFGVSSSTFGSLQKAHIKYIVATRRRVAEWPPRRAAVCDARHRTVGKAQSNRIMAAIRHNSGR